MTKVCFSDFGFAPAIAAALAEAGYRVPTPVQALAIAPQRAGRDLLGSACTGSGKTAAFALPLLHALIAAPRPCRPRRVRALILAPTRELAQQITLEVRRLGGGAAGPRVCAVIGGAPRCRQIRALAPGVDAVVATPGRLIDLMRAGAVGLEDVRHLVIDEADQMLDLGFLETVRRIAADLPPDRQTVMFSATLPAPVEALAAQLLRDPVRVAVAPPEGAPPPVSARAEIVSPRLKHRRLAELLGNPGVAGAIVFCRTRRGADNVGRMLAGRGLNAGVLHGERSQRERDRVLHRFRTGLIDVLVATDLAARGLDLPRVSHVFNFDPPDAVETYIHRIGRTGRAGGRGEAVTLCAPDQIEALRRIEQATRRPLLPQMCRTCRVAVRGGREPPRGAECRAAGGRPC